MTAVTNISAAKALGGRLDAVHVAVVSDEETRQTVKAVGVQLGWARFDIHEGGMETALSLINSDLDPDLLLIDISNSQNPLGAMEAIAEGCRVDTKVIALGLLNDIDLYRGLIDMGVSDYLMKPISHEALGQALRKATASAVETAPSGKAAKRIALIGSRGGVGVTTLAVSTAWAMSQRQKVVLLDLDLQFGNIPISLDVTPGRGLREILSNPERLDSLLIDSAMTKAGGDLRILAADESLNEVVNMAPAGLVALLAELDASADSIVIDVPRKLDSVSHKVLDLVDVVAIVTDQSLSGMRDTQRLLKLVQGAAGHAKGLVVANRVGGVPGEMGRADFERGIEAKISISIPCDVKAAIASAQLGKPFGEVARAPKTVSELQSLVLALAGAEAPAASSSFLNRILRK